MSNLFLGFWSKVSAALTLIAVFFILKTNRQAKKINNLKHENKIATKNIEIAESQAVFKAEILAVEQEDVLKMVDKNAKKSKFDRLNDL